METEYKNTAEIKLAIEKNFPVYLVKIFDIVNQDEIIAPNGMRIKKDNSEAVKKLRKQIVSWENDIEEYKKQLAPYYELEHFDENSEELYDYQEFKDDFFAKILWTVSSALKTPDPDLDRYKACFAKSTAFEVFSAVKTILEGASNYVKNVVPSIKFNMINSIEQLKLDFLNQENMLLPGVIGRGIRSEILHRIYPESFAIMTRKSGWGMFFLTNQETEFVVDKQSDGKSRTSFHWEYEYDRFSLYSNFICNLLEEAFSKYSIKVDSRLRFGYVNKFLGAISKMHEDEIADLSKWKLVEL